MTTIPVKKGALTSSTWESPSLIPVLLMVVKEHLAQWEKQRSASSETFSSPALQLSAQQRINQYLALCRHWQQTPLNDRQQQWLHEIECCLQNYTP